MIDGDGFITGVHPGDSTGAANAIAHALHVVRLTADQRVLSGLVDLHIHAPQWLQLGTGLDLTLERVEASHASIEAIRSVVGGRPLVQPIITPRFVPACTVELPARLGALAASSGVLVPRSSSTPPVHPPGCAVGMASTHGAPTASSVSSKSSCTWLGRRTSDSYGFPVAWSPTVMTPPLTEGLGRPNESIDH